MTQVIPEQQLDLAHIKAALGKFARESGFTYKKNVQLTASLLEFNQKCLVFVPGIVYPAIVIPVRRQGGKSKEETSLIYTFHNGEFNHINNSKYFSCKATESFSWEGVSYERNIVLGDFGAGKISGFQTVFSPKFSGFFNGNREQVFNIRAFESGSEF